MLENLIELIFLGLIGTSFIMLIALIVFAFFNYLTYLFYAFVGFLLVISVGWCVKNLDNFIALFVKPPQPDLFQIPKPNYGNDTLDGLAHFEKKYGMTTVQFMAFVYKDLIPHGMNNLDYVEWVAMAIALGTFQNLNEGEYYE
jgi:hypothetical protein